MLTQCQHDGSGVKVSRGSRIHVGDRDRLTLSALRLALPGSYLVQDRALHRWRGDSGAGVCPGWLSHPVKRLP